MILTTTALRQAATDAQAAVGMIDVAKQAGAAALPGDAFGILCSPLFVPLYSVVQFAADSLMGSVQSSLQRATQELQDAATDFEASEESLSTTFTNVTSALQ